MFNLDKKFELINTICFSQELNLIPIEFKNNGGKDAVFISEPLSIELNSRYKKDESGLELMLLHEMVHYWIFLNKTPKEEHDDNFMKKLAEAERLWGNYKLSSL